MSSSPTDDLARVREALDWLTDEARIPALAAVYRLGEQLAEQADELRVTCVARDSTGKPMKSVHLLGDPEAVRAVVEMRMAGEAAEARVSQLEDALWEIEGLIRERRLTSTNTAATAVLIAREALKS